jgi:hypothetical protein
MTIPIVFERKMTVLIVNGRTTYCKKAVCKVRGLTLLLRIGTLWRRGDGRFFEVLPLASDALLTTLHPFLENVMQTVDHFEISCLRAPFSWLEKLRNRIRRDLSWILCSVWKNWIGGTPLEYPPYSSDLVPCDLPREVLRKRDRHRTFTKFRPGVIRWVHELCKRPSYTDKWGKWYTKDTKSQDPKC